MMMRNLCRQLRLLPGQRSRIDRRLFELQKRLALLRPELTPEPQDNFLESGAHPEQELLEEEQWIKASFQISIRWLLITGEIEGGGDKNN